MRMFLIIILELIVFLAVDSYESYCFINLTVVSFRLLFHFWVVFQSVKVSLISTVLVFITSEHKLAKLSER